MQWLILSDWERPLFGYLSDIMHPLQLWKLSRGKVRSRVRSCPPRNPSWPPHLLEAPFVSQAGPSMRRLWGQTESPSRAAPVVPYVVWRQAFRRGGETCTGSGRPRLEHPGPRDLTAAPSRVSLESGVFGSRPPREGQSARPAPASSPAAVPRLLAAPSLGTHFQPESDPDPTSPKPLQSP